MLPIRVLILADDPLARAGLAAMLDNEEALNVIGHTNPTNTVLDPFPHDIVVFDLGWELDDDLTALTTETPVLEMDKPLLVLLPDETRTREAVTQLNTAERTAPYGILARDADAGKIVAAVNALQAGLIILDPLLTDNLLPIVPTAPNLEPPTASLTPREQEVLDLLAEGLPNKTIARCLTISEYTVKFHVNAILTKLNAASRTEAVVRATRLGLVTL